MDNPQDQLTFLLLSEADLSRWREDPVTVLFLRHLDRLRDLHQAECVNHGLVAHPQTPAYAGRADIADRLLRDCTEPRIKEDLVTTDSTFVDPRLKKVRKHGQTDAQ